MLRRAILVLSISLFVTAAATARDGLDGAALLGGTPASGRGPARATARDLEPRILGDQFFAWDGTHETGVGWLVTIEQGEYVQAFNINGTLIRVVVCALGNVANVTASVSVVVYAADGPGGTPGTLLAQSEATRIPGRTPAYDCSEISVPALEVAGTVFIGARWMPAADQGFFVAADASPTTAVQLMYGRSRPVGGLLGNWGLVRNAPAFAALRALGIGVRVVTMAEAVMPCVETSSTLCLNNDRFRVEVDWRTPNDQRGLGLDANLKTNDSANLYFFQATNLELLIKVLNACTVNNRYWVFFAATTNVEFQMTVNDTMTGQVKTYFNPLDRPAPPVQDTSAFAACP